jgi:hypothetical protein
VCPRQHLVGDVADQLVPEHKLLVALDRRHRLPPDQISLLEALNSSDNRA